MVEQKQAAKVKKQADPLSQDTLVQMVAALQEDKKNSNEQNAKLTATVNQMVNRLQRVEDRTGNQESILVESDRTFKEEDYKSLKKWCESKPELDKFYVLPGYSFKFVSGDPNFVKNKVLRPVDSLVANSETMKSYSGLGAAVIQGFLRDLEDEQLCS